MSKRAKRVSRKSKKSPFKLYLVLILLIALGVWLLYMKATAPIVGRQTFTFSQKVGDLDETGCVHLLFNNKQYCVDDWGKVYNAMDASSQSTAISTGTTVKFEFDADFHTGSMVFVGDKSVPTIFLDKVHSAKATEQ